MTGKLDHCKVAILAVDGFEEAEFVEPQRALAAEGKPIAAICHGGRLLVWSGLVEGRPMTSWPSLQDDIRNAGGKWGDQEVVRDRNLITSRKPDDLPAFNGTLVQCLASRGG